MIQSDQNMHILPDLDMIKEGIYTMPDGTLKPALDIQIIPNSNQDRSRLKFRWKASRMNESIVKFQLSFDEAVYVSSSFGLDIMRVTFRDKYMFVG